jgi:Na+-translocating ferredoxin:NAD+ oxidoreductase RnfC subunit
VTINLSQHIGAKAECCVQKGDRVKTGDCIANPAKGLSVSIHASIDGIVKEVTDNYILIEKD